MGATAYFAQLVGDYLHRGGAAPVQSTYYIGLLGADDVECTGGNYARQQLDPGASNWSAYPDYGNASVINFPEPSVQWHTSGQVTKFGIWDAVSAGNQLYLDDLDAPKDVNAAAPPVYFQIGGLTLPVTGT